MSERRRPVALRLDTIPWRMSTNAIDGLCPASRATRKLSSPYSRAFS